MFVDMCVEDKNSLIRLFFNPLSIEMCYCYENESFRQSSRLQTFRLSSRLQAFSIIKLKYAYHPAVKGLKELEKDIS